MLTKRTKDTLGYALAATQRFDGIVDEIEAALDSPAALSEDAKSAMEIAMGPRDAEEIIAAIEAGSTDLSEQAKDAIEIAMADQKAADELIKEIES